MVKTSSETMQSSSFKHCMMMTTFKSVFGDLDQTARSQRSCKNVKLLVVVSQHVFKSKPCCLPGTYMGKTHFQKLFVTFVACLIEIIGSFSDLVTTTTTTTTETGSIVGFFLGTVLNESFQAV